MPGIFDLPEKSIKGYIQDVIQNIIRKDVLVRNKWRNEEHFYKTTFSHCLSYSIM